MNRLLSKILTRLNKFIKLFIPPIVIKVTQFFLSSVGNSQSADMLSRYDEYIPQGLEYLNTHSNVSSWNVNEILDVTKKEWSHYVSKVQGLGPLGFAPLSASKGFADINHQNTNLIFAYAVALAAHGCKKLSMLDWGGSIGHYHILANALVPMIEIEYHCKEVPVIAKCGQQIFPEAHFYSDNSYLKHKYDFVLVSGSLQYSHEWTEEFDRLASVTKRYFLVNRLPIVEQSPTFMFVQRTNSYGYHTEFLVWCINREEFLDRSQNLGLHLVREFVVSNSQIILGAPEICSYHGFLFEKKAE